MEEGLSFKNKKAVWEYLKDSTWKVSRGAFYGHCKKGYLRPDKETGEYLQADVEAYAKEHLVDAETGKKSKDVDVERRHSKKMDAETRLKMAQAAREELRLASEQGKLIDRDRFEVELAARGVVLYNSFVNMAQSRAAEIINLVDGDQAKIPDLVEMLITEIDRTVNEFASGLEFEVLIQKEEMAA